MCLHWIPRTSAMYWSILLVPLPFYERLLSEYTSFPLLKKKETKYMIILLFTLDFQSHAMLCCCLSVKVERGHDNDNDNDNNEG